MIVQIHENIEPAKEPCKKNLFLFVKKIRLKYHRKDQKDSFLQKASIGLKMSGLESKA